MSTRECFDTRVVRRPRNDFRAGKITFLQLIATFLAPFDQT